MGMIRFALGLTAGSVLVQQLPTLPPIGLLLSVGVLGLLCWRRGWVSLAAFLVGISWAASWGAFRLAETLPGRRTGSDAPASESDAPPGRTRAGRSAVGWRDSAVRRWTARLPDRPSSHLRTRWSDLAVAERESGDGRGAEGNHRPAKCGRAASGTPLGIALSWDTLKETLNKSILRCKITQSLQLLPSPLP